MINIEQLALLEGHLPPRVLGLVMEWAELHQDEIMENWRLLQSTGQYQTIAPLV